jgi:hypothetical protein
LAATISATIAANIFPFSSRDIATSFERLHVTAFDDSPEPLNFLR